MRSGDWLTYYRRIGQGILTVVDVETTGYAATHHRVIEISVLQATLADGILSQQTSLINPQMPIPPKITAYTGISPAMVATAPIAADVFPPYFPTLSSGILTAHNLEFDYPFLQAEYRRLQTNFHRPETEQLCTVQLSRLMLPDLPSRSLPNLVRHFRFAVGPSHRAEADTIACWLLAQRLLTEILAESDAGLLARFARQQIPLKVAAQILGCRSTTAQQRLADAGIASRWVGRQTSGTWMYSRGAVEQLAESLQSDGDEKL